LEQNSYAARSLPGPTLNELAQKGAAATDAVYVGKNVVAKCGFGSLTVFRDLGLLYRD
jgi:hypothetical protein